MEANSRCTVAFKRKRKIFGGNKIAGRSKIGGGDFTAGSRRGKPYGSVKLRSKKNRHTTSIVDKGSTWSCDEMEGTENGGRRKSEIRERDNFLELLSKVQDNRYNNQRYTIKAGSMTDESMADGPVDDVFEDSKAQRSNSLKLANGVIPNGTPARYIKKGPEDLPTVEITDSPSSYHRRIQKAASVGSVSGLSWGSKSPDEQGRPSSAGSRTTGQGEETDRSLSPTQSLTTESVVSPSRKGTEALKKVIVGDGPYPLLITPPDGGYWCQGGDHDMAKGEDGVWRAPEISTEHYTIQTDKTASVYGRYFRKQDHQNYITRDTKRGPVILSLKLEEDYQGTLARVLIRTQKETIYKIIPSSQLPSSKMEPEDYIKIASLSHGSEMNVEKALPLSSVKATELLQKFDEHPLAKTHKFGVIYQQFGQTCEEEIFGNVEHPDSLTEFLEMLGDKVELKGFEGYRGGLDVTNNQTGEHSIYTEFKDRKVMFHVSTLLPHDQGDTQYVQKKRHIGNDIVVVVFQDANTPFCPSMIRSHFVHAYIIVQVEHPNTDHTVYKVAVGAKDEVPDFSPPIPDPAIFQKGAEFRDWLLMKALNAEFNCHQASSFKKLATRTRNQLFLHLVEELALTIEDIDSATLSRELTASLDRGTASPDVSQLSRNKKRRRTLTGMFRKDPSSPALGLSKIKSHTMLGSPKVFRRQPLDLTSPVRHMLAGSTPDLLEEAEHTKLLGLDYSSEHPDTKKEKSSISRKLTFRRHQETTTKEKEKRKPKRTASVNSPAGYSVQDYRGKRGKISPLNKKRHNSSGESSVASGTNLGGSIPYDLPGAVDMGDRSEFNASERPGSALTLEDVSISMGQPDTADVAVQCSPSGSSVTRYHTPASPQPPRSAGAKAEHSKRLHSVNMLSVQDNSPMTQSLPATPIKQRRSPGGFFVGGPPHSPPVPYLSERKQHHTIGSARGRRIQDELSNGRHSADQVLAEREDKLFYRAESADSVNTDTDEMYSSLFHSLEVVNSDAARLREQNFTLIRENVKFASQNRELKMKYLDMKQQLTSAQQQIKGLELKLQQCHLLQQPPTSPTVSPTSSSSPAEE